MSAELAKLFDDLDPNKLRVIRPSKFVFLCGGVIADGNIRAKNLRDYLCRVRPMRLPYEVVLAERATQLYRDTAYGDLISFEEDIARIAAVVLVIAESPGSLAELGAFSSNETIQKSLRVIIQESFALEESFVRYGPIERVKKTRDHLGIFPWRLHSGGHPIINSIKPHYTEIVKFINAKIESIPSSALYAQLGSAQDFYLIYWVIYISFVISPSILYDYIKIINTNLTDQEIRNKVYCMELAGWIQRAHYSGKDYFFVRHEGDPFDYSFKEGVSANDSVRRKMDLRTSLGKAETIPEYVKKLALESRRLKSA